jgi:hypothetical protein
VTLEEKWPRLLTDYEAALTAFENASRALTRALVERHPADYRFFDFVVAEETARDAVVVARMRLIERWRDSVRESDDDPGP